MAQNFRNWCAAFIPMIIDSGLNRLKIGLSDCSFSDGNGPLARRDMNAEKKTFCVYAIQSEVSKRIYVGQTDNLERRFREHNAGRVKSTKNERPWKAIASENVIDREQARWIESRLKSSKGKRLRWIERRRTE